jgi:hypothetical protein
LSRTLLLPIFKKKNTAEVKFYLFYFYLKKILLPLNTVEILCPEANSSSSHKNQTTSIWTWDIAREIGTRAGELKTGIKTQKFEVPGYRRT